MLVLQVKGMGEKQIEVDRRLLKGRMARLRKDIEEVRRAVPAPKGADYALWQPHALSNHVCLLPSSVCGVKDISFICHCQLFSVGFHTAGGLQSLPWGLRRHL